MSGLRGIKRHEPVDPGYVATRPAELHGRAEWSATKGKTTFPTWGNLTWPNCFWAMLGNMTLLQAMVNETDYVAATRKTDSLAFFSGGVDQYSHRG